MTLHLGGYVSGTICQVPLTKHQVTNDLFLGIERVLFQKHIGAIKTVGTHGLLNSYEENQTHIYDRYQTVLIGFCTSDRCHDQKQLWTKGFVSPYSLESIFQGSQGKNLEAETTKNCCLLACSPLNKDACSSCFEVVSTTQNIFSGVMTLTVEEEGREREVDFKEPVSSVVGLASPKSLEKLEIRQSEFA